MVALNSKTYCGIGGSANKVSTKGVSKSLNSITFEDFKKTLFSKEPVEGENRGFKRAGSSIVRYDQKRKCLNYVYLKREVLPCGIATKPLQI